MGAIRELERLEQRNFWQTTTPELPSHAGKPLPDAADVVVIGGGLTGLSAARRAAELGATTVLLDAERLGFGASTRNGGMCHPGYKHGVLQLIAEHGDARGLAIYQESLDAYEHVRTLCSTEIDADFEATGGLSLAYAPSHAAAQEQSVNGLRRAGIEAHLVPKADLRSEIGTDAYLGAMVNERYAGLNPAKLTSGLVRLAEAAGADLHDGVRANRVRQQADGRHVVETSCGAIIARDVIVGTNGYTGGVTPSLRRRILAIRSYIIVTDPLPDDVAREVSPRRRMFSDTKNFLFYWRLTADNRMLFGGRASMWPTSIARTAAILQRSMVALHPQLRGTRVAYAWGGNVGFTYDRMPHAGRADGVAYAVGCCGSGVAIMPWLGRRVAEWVGGSTAPELASLRFPLVPAPYEGRAWFLPFAGEYWKTQDRLAAREAKKRR
ncbi:MAG TPA: FAD-binding oxidoreductase [Candidatus Limnocylindrales bacterium]